MAFFPPLIERIRFLLPLALNTDEQSIADSFFAPFQLNWRDWLGVLSSFYKSRAYPFVLYLSKKLNVYLFMTVI